ncbi:MAG TPA: FlgD immunoglobulin-like domain containing protein, partial [Candidatus Krumholzibacteria bacterium]|nr:FlgD immunoglobulin-like domain containing protein [Candidatus Krumholzibacteria bacterium]
EGVRRLLIFRAGTGTVVDGFTIRNGTQISAGAGLRVQLTATATVKNCVFLDNYSEFDGAAVICRDAGSVMDVQDCVFKNNFAEHRGGAGVVVVNGTATFTRCTFDGNDSGEVAALGFNTGSICTVSDCLFKNNGSEISGIYGELSTVNVLGNTFVNNHASGATIHIFNSNVTFKRNLLVNDPNAVGWNDLGNTTDDRTCNIYWHNKKATSSGVLKPGETVVDPLFCDALHDNFHIDSNSPAAPGNNSCGLIGAFGVACGPVAVAISSFEAKARDGVVSLHGTFASDLGVQAVNVYRGEGSASFVRVATVGDVDGGTFDYTDRSVAPGTSYRYQIGVMDGDGEFMSQIQRVQVAPLQSRIDQNHPNPFNPQTTIHYTLSTPGRVTMAVYDATGRLVRTLLDENQSAGARDVTWNGQDDRGTPVASGVYFYKMTAGKFSQTRRMVLLK